MSHRNHRFDPIVIDDDDDEDDEAGGMQVDFSHQQRQRGMFGYDTPDHIRGSPSTYHTSIEQEKKVRSRLREERHAALSVLMDRELLMVQALAAQETLPQTRRRFLTKLIAPEDPDIAASIRADRFIIQAQPQHLSHSASSSSNTVPVPVSRSIVDVCETDDAGWMKPKPKTREMASSSPVGGGGASGSVSMSTPTSSAKSGKSNSRTPDRGRTGKARASSSRHHHNQQQNRERDRRRRWSGAERDDGGFAVQRFSP